MVKIVEKYIAIPAPLGLGRVWELLWLGMSNNFKYLALSIINKINVIVIKKLNIVLLNNLIPYFNKEKLLSFSCLSYPDA